jgi:hypothetical protein
MICAVMQPTYLPWAGYFALIDLADTFMFYDDAQFSKSSWHYRNQIQYTQDKKWLSLDIIHKKNQLLSETKIALLNKNIRVHKNTIKTYYSKSAYYEDVNEVMTYLSENSCDNLARLNIKLIIFISHKMKLNTIFTKSSDFIVSGERSDKLAKYLEILKCTQYISPIGSKKYLQEDNIIETKFPTIYCDFIPLPYKQKNSKEDFISHLSIIDVIANLGWEQTAKYIRNMSCQIKSIN